MRGTTIIVEDDDQAFQVTYDSDSLTDPQRSSLVSRLLDLCA